MRKRRRESGGEEDTFQRTIWDIARHAGVSIATVSRVLNGKPYVSPLTRQKVQEAASQLGYTAKSAGSLPETGGEQEDTEKKKIDFPQSPAPLKLIGLTSISMRSGEYAEILTGITEALHARNARPVICPIPRRHNCGMPFLERVMSGVTEGALILGSTDEDEELVEAYQGGFPLVVIHPSRPVNPQLPVVAASRWNAAKTATDYLLSLGHQRICLLIARFSQYSSQFRHDNSDSIVGFQAALLAAGRPVSPELVCEVERNTREAGEQAMLQLLSLPEPPTAILALSDALAAGVLQAAHARGLEVPAQLSLVSFADLETIHMAVPAMTTIQIPFQEMGRMGVDMLSRLISGQSLDVARVELSTRLVVRDSTAPPFSGSRFLTIKQRDITRKQTLQS